jgi:hypothetical protein
MKSYPNSIDYILDSINRLNLFVINSLNSLPFEIKRILNRSLTSGDYALGNTEVSFFSNDASLLVNQAKTLTKVKPAGSHYYSVIIPADDGDRYPLATFSSNFNITDVKIIGGEWQFFIPAKVIGTGAVKIIAEVLVQDTSFDQTLLFTATSPKNASNDNYYLLQNFIHVDGTYAVNADDIIVIKLYAAGNNPTENTVMINYSVDQPMYFTYPKEQLDANSLTANLDAINSAIATIETNVDTVTADVGTVTTSVSNIVTDLGTVTTDITTINSAISTLNSTVDNLKGGLKYQTGWNANTNTPTLPEPSTANNGHYWIVSVDGNTDIDGETDWKVNDWVVSDGTAYTKYDNTPPVVNVSSATTSAEGISRRATNVEIPAGIEDTAHITSYGLINFLTNLVPTTTIRAFVRRATNLEITAGIEDTPYVSPAGLTTWLADKLSNNAFGAVYASLAQGLPGSGTLGQLLMKTATSTYSSVWTTVRTIGNSTVAGTGDIINDATVNTSLVTTDKFVLTTTGGNIFTATWATLKAAILGGGTFTGDINLGGFNLLSGFLKNMSIAQYNWGTSSANAAISLDVTVAHTHLITCGGAHTLTFTLTGWTTTSVSYIELVLTNMGLGTFVVTNTVQYKNPDDTYTTNFATYLTARQGETALKSSGVDIILYEYINGTLYGTLI